MRVLNTVKLLYYEALGAQQLVDLRQQLVTIARQAVDTSEQLMNVGQADQPDLLETQNEGSEADLHLVAALSDRDEAWQMLAALVGSPDLRPARLEGSLEENLAALDEGAALTELLRASPEIKRAIAGVERARAALVRARAERIPDVFVRGAIGYSQEPLETLAGTVAGRTGPEASIEVGVRLPLFNRNQGNIATAQAELTSAENEVKRQELALRARFASAFSGYRDSFRTVQEYKQNILPRAQRAYELYLAKYQEMAAAYPQVIIAKRTLFQGRVSYTDALVALQQNAARIQGFLLTGGLDAPAGGSRDGSMTVGQSPGIKSGAQGAGIRDSGTEPER
jgi:cobalt-zinc-cadmium efflux system outer membrane protein